MFHDKLITNELLFYHILESLISNILSLLICSVIINMSGNLIGVNSILLFLSNLSPILSWFVLYNMYISHSIHYISKHWINISNYRMELEVGISLIEIFTVILLLNVSYAILLLLELYT